MSAQPLSLVDALELAGWSPRQLTAAINGQLSRQGRDRDRIDATAAYPWVRRGYRPRPPIPGVAASVLSEQLGFPVTVEQLWPGRPATGREESTAADRLEDMTSVEDFVRELGHISATATAPRPQIVGATAADLTTAVVDQLRGSTVDARHRVDRERVLPPQVDLIAAHVAALRRLDDKHGGGSLSLRYVTAEMRSVVDLVEYASYERKVGHQLLTIAADLAQLLGWMQFDSSRYGEAERYLLLSIGISRSLGATDRAANAIGMLTYVSAFAGHGRESVRLAEAASREHRGDDPILRARLLGREATAAAADGDLSGFRRNAEAGMELLLRHQRRDAPTFLYYLEPGQLAAETGQCLVALAERTTASRKRLLTEAIELLEPLSGVDQRPEYPRSALLHTTFLAKAYLMRGDVPESIRTIAGALTRLPQVQSPRVRTYLRALRPALARRTRSPIVAEFLPYFDRALSRT